MTTQLDLPSAAPEPSGATAAPGEPTPMEDRGSLDIDDVVVRKVVEYSADLVPGTARVSRRVGLGVGDRGASAGVDVRSGHVDVQLDLALHYPGQVTDVVRKVRESIDTELTRIVGYHVRSLRVTVSALVPESHQRVL